MSDTPRRETNQISAVLTAEPAKKTRPRGNPHMINGPSDEKFPGVRAGDPPRNPLGIGSPGRAVGRKPNAVVFAEQMMTEAAPEIAQKMIALAKDGNVAAAKMCIEYALPKGRYRSVRFPIQIPSSEDPAEFEAAGRQLVEAVANGLISTAEGVEVAKILQHYLDAVKTGSLARRVTAIEQGDL